MPMEDRAFFGEAEGVRRAGRRLDGIKSDFLVGISIYSRSMPSRDELRPQATPEHRNTSLNRIANELLFRAEPRQGSLIVHAHGSAHGDYEIEVLQRRQGRALKETGVTHPGTALLQPRSHAADIFKGDML